MGVRHPMIVFLVNKYETGPFREVACFFALKISIACEIINHGFRALKSLHCLVDGGEYS